MYISSEKFLQVQNADDNIYPENVEQSLTFIVQEKGIVVLNNEMGFSAENVRALCDVGNSTKRGCSTGYIGKKGIGFKSVFRVLWKNICTIYFMIFYYILSDCRNKNEIGSIQLIIGYIDK